MNTLLIKKSKIVLDTFPRIWNKELAAAQELSDYLTPKTQKYILESRNTNRSSSYNSEITKSSSMQIRFFNELRYDIVNRLFSVLLDDILEELPPDIKFYQWSVVPYIDEKIYTVKFTATVRYLV